MKEVLKLLFDTNVEGFEVYGGKSYNVWGKVPFPESIVHEVNELKRNNPKAKSCIWTAYDGLLYKDDKPIRFCYVPDAERQAVSDKFYEAFISLNDLPQQISATFKSTFSPYSAIVENLGMRIAHVLDLPTSYNYIVSFDPKDYPEIIDNYPKDLFVSGKIKQLQSLGIVSIDFLQKGEVLIHFDFDKSLKRNNYNNGLNYEDNLVSNWISKVDKIAKEELGDCPKEILDHNIYGINSRIARSYLFRELCGDCDFTAYNGGIIINIDKKIIRFAPNFDFGECFNALVRNCLMKYGMKKNDYDNLSSEEKMKLIKVNEENPGSVFGIRKEVFDKLPQNVIDSLIKQANMRKQNSVSKISKMWASENSEENFEYVVKNFPIATKEFFDSIDRVVANGDIDKIIDSYGNIYHDGKPLLTEEERGIFKQYLSERLEWLRDNYHAQLKNLNMNFDSELCEH